MATPEAGREDRGVPATCAVIFAGSLHVATNCFVRMAYCLRSPVTIGPSKEGRDMDFQVAVITGLIAGGTRTVQTIAFSVKRACLFGSGVEIPLSMERVVSSSPVTAT